MYMYMYVIVINVYYMYMQITIVCVCMQYVSACPYLNNDIHTVTAGSCSSHSLTHSLTQGSTVNMNINQRMFDNGFNFIDRKSERLGVVLLVGKSVIGQ